jgi:hypothetical protein
VSPYARLKTKTDPVSETPCFLVVQNSGRRTTFTKPVILCVIHHRQNHWDSKYLLLLLSRETLLLCLLAGWSFVNHCNFTVCRLSEPEAVCNSSAICFNVVKSLQKLWLMCSYPQLTGQIHNCPHRKSGSDFKHVCSCKCWDESVRPGSFPCLFLRRKIWKKKKLQGLSPRANYTDRATAACRRSNCQLVRIEGATWSAWRIPPAVF